MGFFASRKAEDNDSYQVAIGVGGGSNDKSSVVQVIRSRFYGKKGKEREDQPPSFLGSASTAQVLSPSNIPIAPNPVSATPTRGAGPSILRNHLERPPTTPQKKRSHDTLPAGQTPIGIKDTPGPSSHTKTVSVGSSAQSPRKNTDTVTVTLAQRLNELSVANSEGLLSDDEYRILRANLFERFSSNVTVPIETPVVPATPQPRPRKAGQERPSPRPLSNFQVDRPLSISSKTSAVSGVTNILRRATGRQSNSKDLSDTSSVWSSTSNTSFFRLPRGLTRKSSNSSVRTNTSRQADTVSVVSSRVPTKSSERGTGENLMSPMRSAGSIRKLAAPPSSFPGGRGLAQEIRNPSTIQNIFDEGHLTTVKDISQEILNVEAEAKRVMDAFSGLEVTTLAKAQRGQVRPSLKSADFGKNSNTESQWGQDSDGLGPRRINLADDAISMRSGISTGTTPSMAPSIPRSGYSTKNHPRTKLSISSPTVLTISRPTSLHRKNSTSSVTSDRRLARAAMAPPVPALPPSLAQGHLKAASASNLSLSRSTGHLPMNTVPEDEGMSTSGTVKSLRLDEDLENEMEEIRRRREEVSHRYDARLEYLRAKLKGAQLHEKLMRK